MTLWQKSSASELSFTLPVLAGSEPAGVAKMTRVMMMMMIYHTVYPISNTPGRNELMSIIGQQPCGACHPKENIFGPENRNCNNYAGTEV